MLFLKSFPFWSEFFVALPAWLLLMLLIYFFLNKYFLHQLSDNKKRFLGYQCLLFILAAGVVFFLLGRPIGSLPLPKDLAHFYQVRHIPSADRLTVAEWIATLYNVWSIPWVGMLSLLLIERVFGCQLWRAEDWSDFWTMGVVASFLLYPGGLGLTKWDPYSWGWYLGPLQFFIAIFGAYLIWKQSRLLPLLFLPLIAFFFQLEPTTNLWDYLIDPCYGIISLIVLLRQLYQSYGFLLQRRLDIKSPIG